MRQNYSDKIKYIAIKLQISLRNKEKYFKKIQLNYMQNIIK